MGGGADDRVSGRAAWREVGEGGDSTGGSRHLPLPMGRVCHSSSVAPSLAELPCRARSDNTEGFSINLSLKGIIVDVKPLN